MSQMSISPNWVDVVQKRAKIIRVMMSLYYLRRMRKERRKERKWQTASNVNSVERDEITSHEFHRWEAKVRGKETEEQEMAVKTIEWRAKLARGSRGHLLHQLLMLLLLLLLHTQRWWIYVANWKQLRQWTKWQKTHWKQFVSQSVHKTHRCALTMRTLGWWDNNRKYCDDIDWL